MLSIRTRCLELARQSKSKVMGFGAAVVLGDQIFFGRNRRLKRNEKPPFPVCPWSIHAEQDAIYQTLKKLRRKDLSGGLLYVIGIFTDTGKIYIPKKPVSTCHRCYKLRETHGLGVRIPTKRGWRKPIAFFSVHKQVKKTSGATSNWRRTNR